MLSLDHSLSVTSNYIDEYNIKACLVGLTKYLEQRRITLSILKLLLAKHGDTDSDEDGD
eukprot:SAG31_NODE_154_length_22184_cov_25.917142_4_plen_59_part_00